MANDKNHADPLDQKPDLTGLDRAALPWRNFSGHGGASCVEAAAVDHGVALRDSKDPAGTVLAFSANEWSRFVRAVQNGFLDDTVVGA